MTTVTVGPSNHLFPVLKDPCAARTSCPPLHIRVQNARSVWHQPWQSSPTHIYHAANGARRGSARSLMLIGGMVLARAACARHTQAGSRGRRACDGRTLLRLHAGVRLLTLPLPTGPWAEAWDGSTGWTTDPLPALQGGCHSGPASHPSLHLTFSQHPFRDRTAGTGVWRAGAGRCLGNGSGPGSCAGRGDEEQRPPLVDLGGCATGHAFADLAQGSGASG